MIAPGEIRKLGSIFPAERIAKIGESVVYCFERLLKMNDMTADDVRSGEILDRYRYPILPWMGSDISMFVEPEHSKWLDAINQIIVGSEDGQEPVMKSVEMPGVFSNFRTIAYILYQRNRKNLGWHVDETREVRLMTNVGQTPTTVMVATSWTDKDVNYKTDPLRVPQAYEELTIDPGETYILNNVFGDLFNKHPKMTPHATPSQPGRLMLQQAFEWEGVDYRWLDDLIAIGGLSIDLAVGKGEVIDTNGVRQASSALAT